MKPAVAKYVYERLLGGGGMAEVFAGRIVGVEGFSRPVAIKRVLPTYSADSTFAVMFINEAQLCARLHHANVIDVIDFSRDEEGRLCLVMELVEGKDLDALMETGPLPLPAIVYVLVQMLQGLGHAHEMTTPEGKALGIVHRDISPHNVLVSWDGEIKVSDFGIAKAMQASGAGQSGILKGKPGYMAPEQVTGVTGSAGPDAVDHRADLFAVGVVAYALLTGQQVYQGTTASELLTDVIQVARGWRQLVAPTVLRPDLPWDLAQVVMKLLAPNREHRYASARDAISALLASSSAVANGAELLAQVMAQRFPADAPARVLRRAAGQPGLVAGPEGATWVVTPPPSRITPAALGSIAAGTPTLLERRTPAPPTASMSPPVAPAAMGTARHRRWPLAIALLLAAAAAVASVLVVVRAPTAAGLHPGAAATAAGTLDTLDAAATPVVAVTPDAGLEIAPDAAVAAAAAAPAVAPDAGSKPASAKPHHRERKPRTGKAQPPRDDSAIHDIVKDEGK